MLFIITFTCSVFAQTKPSKSTRFVLDSGLTVVVKPELGTGLVSIVAIIKTGASQETIQNAGIGNFVAQLLLASTRLSSAEEVSAIADQVGGNIDAQWRLDFTSIRTVTTSSMFSRAMSLMGECLTDANFEEQWVDQVRGNLFNQLKSGNTNTFEDAYNRLREMLYEDNGYKRPYFGFERTIKLAAPKDLKRFYDTYYVPNNIVISIVGDVNTTQAVDCAEKAFAGLSPKKLPIQREIPYEHIDVSKTSMSETNAKMAYILMGWLAPGMVSTDYPATAVLSTALGGGKGSLMFTKIRQDKGIGYDIGTIYPKLENQSHIFAYIITDPYKQDFPGVLPTMVLDDAKQELLNLVEYLKTTPLSEQQLSRAKGYTIGTYALSHQHLLDRSFDLGWMEAVGGGFQKYSTFADDIDKVTAIDVQKTAQKYLNNYALVLLLPKKQ